MSAIDTILLNLKAVGFDNPANDAIFEMIAQGIGGVIDNTLTEFTNTKNTIIDVIANQRYGKAAYYVNAALQFQYGDDLIPSAGTLDPTYAVIDPTKQVIKQAAFQNFNANLSLKIAGLDSLSGNLIQLPQIQQDAFNAYYVFFEIPGIPISIICLPANIFSFNAICTFISGYDKPTLQANIAAAVQAFKTTFNFNGILYSDALSTYIKAAVPGVIDFYLSSTQIDGVPFTGFTTLTAGYFNFGPNILNNIQYNSVNA